MLNRYTLSVLGVLIALAAILFLHADEEDRILQRLEQLCALTDISSPESGVEQLTRASQIGQYFSERTVFDPGDAGHGTILIDSRDELVRRIIRGRARLVMLQLSLRDARVSIDDNTAEVVLTGSGLGQIKGEADRFLEIHTVAVRLRKEAGEWVITGATHLRDERQSSSGRSD